jgi:glycosyltransferase involved in cell wall biosynthesis
VKVAFVVQRCGREVNGGAESECLQVAQRMARYWSTEVLTTCAVDYMTWENFYPEGEEHIGPALIRRFYVDQPRDVQSFNQLSNELRARQSQTSQKEQENWMRAQGPVSTRLFEYLKTEKDNYDAFIFFGYLYATTYFGLPLVAEKSYLAALAHDEWPIHFKMWDALFSLPRKLIYNTKAERQFLQHRFPRLRLPGQVIGVGIERPNRVQPDRFRRKYRLDDPFLLYVGRIDKSKGCDEMFDYFIRRQNENGRAENLVLTGSEVMPIPFNDNIIHLGFITESEKWDAMAACNWLLMPSHYESLSMALLEAWSVGRPCLVNGRCDVLTDHCRTSNGGVWYHNFQEWDASISIISSEAKAVLGRQGQRYVQTHYSWPRVERDYVDLIEPRRRGSADASDNATTRLQTRINSQHLL